MLQTKKQPTSNQTENYLIRSIDERGTRLQKISPYLFGFRGINNALFLPLDRDLPPKGLVLKAYTFDFGFNNAANVLTPYQEADISIPVRKNLIVWGINGYRQVQPTSTGVPAEVSPAYLVSIFQQHEGTQFQIFNKAIANLNGTGLAKKPCILKEPHVVIAGDSLDVDVTNTGNYNLAVQVVIYGGEFE